MRRLSGRRTVGTSINFYVKKSLRSEIEKVSLTALHSDGRTHWGSTIIILYVDVALVLRPLL